MNYRFIVIIRATFSGNGAFEFQTTSFENQDSIASIALAEI
jgi:hypothetical protein